MVLSSGSGRPSYKPALSLESHPAAVCETDINLDVEAEGHKYRRRRRITIFAIVAIFLTAGAILVFTVVHDQQRLPEVRFVEENCTETDQECLAKRCPITGFNWRESEESDPGCKEVEGYENCPVQEGGSYYKYYYLSGEDPKRECLFINQAGIVPSSYKQMCYPGYLWVEWKKKCLRLEDSGKL